MANFLRHEPCPGCGSRNNLARYDDGSAHCFAKCGHNEPSTDKQTRMENTNGGLRHTPGPADGARRLQWLGGDVRALEDRGITRETCQLWGYKVTEDGRQIASYRDGANKIVAQKVRGKNAEGEKTFTCIGNPSSLLYGMWLWGNGKSITITEGEIDALSVSQAFRNKYPVVSLPNGASSAAKALAENFEYLSKFAKIVLMFDMDKAGREAIQAAAAVLPPGRVFIANLKRKDANECLKAGKPEEIVDAFWQAREWRPDGIVSGADFTLDRLKQAAAKGYPLSLPRLQNMVLGLRKAELTLLTAGSGIGKSSWARELAYELHQVHGCSIGNVFLEENNDKTAQGYVALHNNVPLGLLRSDPSVLTDAQWTAGLEVVRSGRMWFYNHFGSLDSTNLLAKLRYLAVVCKVDFIILDHISIVTSGMESSSEGERKDIDILMTKLRSLAEETGVGIIAIVHLKRAQGKSFGEGDQISLNDLRGSGSLEQLSDNVFGLERDQQADEGARDMSLIRVLKCRETGDTGPADTLLYDRQTGRLKRPIPANL
jgi:twinkle protein